MESNALFIGSKGAQIPHPVWALVGLFVNRLLDKGA